MKYKKIKEAVSKNNNSERIREQNYEILLIRKLLDNNNILYYYNKKFNPKIEIGSHKDEFILILSNSHLLEQVKDVDDIAMGIIFLDILNYIYIYIYFFFFFFFFFFFS